MTDPVGECACGCEKLDISGKASAFPGNSIMGAKRKSAKNCLDMELQAKEIDILLIKEADLFAALSE